MSSGDFGSFPTPPSSLPSISEDTLAVPEIWFLNEVSVIEDKPLGAGSYGTVYVANWKGCKVACKRLHCIFFESVTVPEHKRAMLKTFAKELNILCRLNHPNIVQFYGVYKESGISQDSLELSPDTLLVQELMHCALDVRNRSASMPGLSVRNVIDISLGLTSALRYLHERAEPIVHRDLASKNVLLSSSGVPKLADLGVAKVLSSSVGNNSSLTQQHTRQPGTELYMPPEVKIEGLSYDSKIDVFSFGAIVLEICLRRDLSTVGEAFRLNPLSGSLEVIPEVDRRRKDFEELGDHVLRPLILACLSPKAARPTARDLGAKLLLFKKSVDYTNEPDVPIIMSPATMQPRSTINGSCEFPPSDAARQSYYEEETRALSSRCETLQQRVEELMSDKDYLSRKLDEYLRAEREDSVREELTEEVSALRKIISEQEDEVAKLKNELKARDETVSELTSLTTPVENLREFEIRDQRAMLMHKLTKLQKTLRTRDTSVKELQEEVELLKVQLSKEKSLRAKAQLQYIPPSGHGGSNFSSLPSLESLSLAENKSTMGVQARASEIQKLKQANEKYKLSLFEADQRLKNALLDLQKSEYQQRMAAFASGRSMSAAQESRMAALASENSLLKSQLGQLAAENSRLRCELPMRY